jgi:hypothetical protein
MIKDYLPPVCVHCGKIENVLDDTNPCISALYGQFSVVRSIYESFRCQNRKTLCSRDAEDRQYNYSVAVIF